MSDRSDETGAEETGTAVDKALSILELVARTPTPLSLAAIAEHWNMPKPTTHRLVQTLVRRGYVRQDADSTYVAGPRTLELGRGARARFDYARVARPSMSDLHDETGKTVQFGTADDFEVRCVDQIDGGGPVRMASQVGQVLDLHTTAIGKAVLAYSAPERREEFLARESFEQKTPKSIVTRRALVRRLDLVFEQGYAIDEAEDQLHVIAVAAPVFSAHNLSALGAVAIVAPDFEMSRVDAEAIAPRVVATAASISTALGAAAPDLPKAHRPYV